MPARKIQDEGELKRWYEEGRTYDWMSREYERKYHLTVSPSTFSNLRARRGWDRRISRDDELIPWAVQRRHRWSYAVAMLRFEARLRDGMSIPEDRAKVLASWKRGLEARGEVVAYSPETGFTYVAKRSTDTDIVRQPESGRTERKARR